MMMGVQTFDIPFSGDFSLSGSMRLAARASFVDGMRTTEGGDEHDAFDLVFPIENSWQPVAVRVTQVDGKLRGKFLANPEGAKVENVCSELRRIFSLEADGVDFQNVGKRDRVVSDSQLRMPGIRPVLFPTPYEAAARAVIGQRIQVKQAAKIHAAIAKDSGVAMNADGTTVYSFPAPSDLMKLTQVQGLAERKVAQLRLLGAAAAAGWLDSIKLRAMTRQDALVHLQKLAGIGPFSADLILIRGAGDPDAFPASELRLQRAMTVAYKLPGTSDVATFEKIAESWRPYRSWVGLLLRNSTYLTLSGDFSKTPQQAQVPV
jgi:DNA-3-methyladenine glycosylase II